ncbi:MAG: exodeoxyribonuclease VII large subunit [Anaerolineae bacterium]|nr:exodeoxyribonuclease VII large subunit [Anaerolineae bacterium]
MIEHTWTVGALTRHIRETLELDYRLQDVWLEGEVSNFTQAQSGHLYFTLKDPDAQIRCVMWRAQAERLAALPNHGDRVEVHGKVTVYAPRGEYQVVCDHLKPAGLGDLHRQFELLKAKLEAEGLFDPARKRPIPAFPRQIGVVTSPTAAAFQDVQNVLRRRWPAVEVILSPAQVQGEKAPPEIIAALNALNAHTGVDVILVVRGGGSLEDLWCFNDERVARAVAASRIPVVSGVGHETDFTLADFAADLRAPTPSAAAELVTPDRQEYMQAVDILGVRAGRALEQSLDRARRQVEGYERALRHLAPGARIQEARRRVQALGERAARQVRSDIALHRQRLVGMRAALDGVSPRRTLARGYAVVTRAGDNALLTDAAGAPPDTVINVRLNAGSLRARVEAPPGKERDDE